METVNHRPTRYDDCRGDCTVDCGHCKGNGPPSNDWTPSYESWRHGGWYVTNVRYPSGAVGCVSRNYTDRKWRIACEAGAYPGSPSDRTFKSRDDAARCERRLIASGILS